LHLKNDKDNRMNNRIKKIFFSHLSERDRRHWMQMILVVLLSILAIGAIVAMEMHHLHHLPVRPPSLFS